MKQRSQWIVEQIAEFPHQEQTGTITFRKKGIPATFWCRLSEETEEYYDNGKKTRVVDHISVEFFEDAPAVVNGITVGGGLRFMRRSDGELFFRGYNTLRRCREDGGYIMGGDTLPDATHKATRKAMEDLAASLFVNLQWLARERMVLRKQEMERAEGKVAEAKEELAKVSGDHFKAMQAYHAACTKLGIPSFPA